MALLINYVLLIELIEFLITLPNYTFFKFILKYIFFLF